MIPLAAKIADELATPKGRNLQERLLQAMFMMERYRGVCRCGISPLVVSRLCHPVAEEDALSWLLRRGGI